MMIPYDDVGVYIGGLDYGCVRELKVKKDLVNDRDLTKYSKLL